MLLLSPIGQMLMKCVECEHCYCRLVEPVDGAVGCVY